jgi:hypothetical protein
MSNEHRFEARRVDDNATLPECPYQFGVFDLRAAAPATGLMGPLWTEAEARVVAEALTRARTEGVVTDIHGQAETAIAEYRADRGQGDGGWGEHLCEVLEEILATVKR